MHLVDRIKDEIRDLEASIKETSKQANMFPNGRLRVSKYSGSGDYRWRVSVLDESTGKWVRRTIPKSRENEAAEYAMGDFLHTRLKAMKKQLRVLKAMVREYEPACTAMSMARNCEELGRLLSLRIKGVMGEWDEITNAWASESYVRCTKYPEYLKYPTMCGIMVRSKSEVIIADLLFKFHIPFRYEPEMIINGRVYYPDFLIMHPITHKLFVWEHFGMMDNPDYIDRNVAGKVENYAHSGWILDLNLIISTETREHPFVEYHAHEKVAKYLI